MTKRKRRQAESARKKSPDERGRLLRVFRKSYDVTLEQMADLAELSQPMLTRFETGTRNISADAWTRVTGAMTRIAREKGAARIAELAKANKIAATLGVLAPVLLSPFAGPINNKIAREKLEAAGLQFPVVWTPELQSILFPDGKVTKEEAEKAEELIQLLDSSVDEELEAQIKKNPAALLQDWKNKTKAIEDFNRRRDELIAQGYVMMPKVVEEERDQLKARVAELEQELRIERAKKPD